jgi:heme o synthase
MTAAVQRSPFTIAEHSASQEYQMPPSPSLSLSPTAVAELPAEAWPHGGLPSPPEMTTGSERAGRSASRTRRTAVAQQLRDYVTLTKPHIISLLLVTTVTPMIAAAGGWPGGWVVLWALLGGYLMAGGANSVNMFIDRDIDAVMGRTALRPIPSGRMSPAHVLLYGLTLATIAFFLFLTLVNLAAALLALGGFLYYVLVYTLWLKRRSPQNIVIGGGAGAFPPLVGWAAVTGNLSLTALGLFVVVVLWTPPHFWALALVKQKDYGRAGVPMAPNVWGERRTLRQMVVYTFLLIGASVGLSALGVLGPVYGVLAAGLGLWFLRHVLTLYRAASITQPAWKAYRASLLYLFLLFLAVAVDALV